MRQHLLGIAAIAIIFALSHPAMAVYHVEVTSAPGQNQFVLELWGDDAEPGNPVSSAAGQVQFSNFTGNVDASSLGVDSLVGLNGFNITSSSGSDFSSPITFGVLDFSGGFNLPVNATSPQQAWAFLQVNFSSTNTGTFDAFVLDPAGSQGTIVNGLGSPHVVGSTSAATISAVPEPSSFILVGLMAGLGYGCVWLRRRRTKSE